MTMDDSTNGYTTVPNWMLAAEDVSAHMVLVYAALGTWTDREGTAWPSIASIATRAKMSDRSARQALRDLEALGLVETIRRGRHDGGQTSNLYRLHTTVTPRQEMQGGVQVMQGAPARGADEQEPQEQAPLANARGEKRERASRIPDPFVVTAEMWEWSREQGHEHEWVREQTRRFVDYWRGASGQTARKVDWPATWRNWLRRSWDERKTPRGGPARETPDERFRRLMAQADAMESQGAEQRSVTA